MEAEARLNNLLTKPPAFTFNFGKALTTSSVGLRGVGSLLDNGYPVPSKGYLYKMSIFNETSVVKATVLVPIDEDDCVSIYATHDGDAHFTITVLINGVPTDLLIEDHPESTDVYVTLYFGLD